MTPALALYLAATSAAAPLARLLLRRRLKAGKEHPERWRERLGHAGLARPEGPLLWFHAASVGESLSILPLLSRLSSERADLAMLVTSGTVTSARLLAERLPAGAMHQFAPVDTGRAVDRFLAHWRPDVAVWIESEIWPRLVWSVGRRGIPALLLNARMGSRSRRRWSRLRRAAGELFGVFDYVQAQDRETAQALTLLGVAPDRLHLAGSIKQSAPPLPCDAAELLRFREALEGRFVWVAASTHPGEEELAIAAHRVVLAAEPGALLILAPRHPTRGDDVAALLDRSGLAWLRRGAGTPEAAASVYLADTLGELGLWYRLGRAAFVGGSMGGIGGHNPYEPIALGVPVLHGPETGNFADVYAVLAQAEGALCITSERELGDAVLGLTDARAAEALNRRAAAVVAAGSTSPALERAMRAILDRLPAEPS